MEHEFTYRKSLNHNYLVSTWNGGDDWQLNMLLENNIPVLLPLSLRLNEGREELYYEISSLQPLSRIYDHKEIACGDAARLLLSLRDGIGTLQEYMLTEDCLRISPQLLYVDPESLTPRLLYLPGQALSLREQLLGLAEYFMEHIEQNDPAAAMWAYRLYKRLRNENFVLSELDEVVLPKQDAAAAVKKSPGQPWSAEAHEPKEALPAVYDDGFLTDEDEGILLSFGGEEEEEIKPLPWWRSLLGGRKEKKAKPERRAKAEKKEKDEKPLRAAKSFGKKKEPDADVEFDFSGALADLAPLPDIAAEDTEESPEDYGKTIFLGNTDEPVENVLVEKNKGLRIPMKHFPFTIGKVKDKVDLPLSDNSVSRIHARIFMQDGRAYLKDCNSTNGTYINGIQLQAEEEVMLEREDEIKIGRVVFCYC